MTPPDDRAAAGASHLSRLASAAASRLLWLARQAVENRRLFRLAGIPICVLILVRIDVAKAVTVLGSVDLTYLTLSLAAQAVALVVSTWRWQLIMQRLGVVIPLRRSLTYQLVGTAAGIVTPGQFGEFVKVLYQRRHGAPLGEAFLSILLDRLYDLVVLVAFGFVAAISIWGLSRAQLVAIVGGAVLMVVVAVSLARGRLVSADWVSRLLVKASPRPYRQAVERDAVRLVARLKGLSPALLGKCLLISVANYLILLLRNFLLLFSLHLVVAPWYFAMVVPLMRLVGLLPISVAGIGTRDITIIYLLGRAGISQESALVLSVLGLLTLQLQALIGLLVWWRYPPQSVVTGAPADSVRAIGAREVAPVPCGAEGEEPL